MGTEGGRVRHRWDEGKKGRTRRKDSSPLRLRALTASEQVTLVACRPVRYRLWGAVARNQYNTEPLWRRSSLLTGSDQYCVGVSEHRHLDCTHQDAPRSMRVCPPPSLAGLGCQHGWMCLLLLVLLCTLWLWWCCVVWG